MTEFAIPLVTGQAVSQAADMARRVRSPRAGRTDRGLTAMAVAGVAALSALGWVTQLHRPPAARPGRWSGSMGGHPVAAMCGAIRLRRNPGCRCGSAPRAADRVRLDASGAVLGGDGCRQCHRCRPESPGPGRPRHAGSDDGSCLASAVQILRARPYGRTGRCGVRS
jgi:hypothetical protein